MLAVGPRSWLLIPVPLPPFFFVLLCNLPFATLRPLSVVRCATAPPLPPFHCCPVYVVGLPLGIFLILYKRRNKLFGPDSEENLRTHGFLYVVRGLV